MTDTAIQSPLKVIEPHKGWLSINWAELWAYRELLYFLTWRDIKVRYKQTVLGVLWALIQPVMKLIVFSIIFGRLANLSSEGYPYPIYAFAALLPWQFFSESLARSSGSVVGGGPLISKVYFPRLIIPIASVGSCIVDFAISFAVLVGLMFYYQIPLTISTLAIIPLVGLTVLVSLGVGIFLSALTVAYRDFRYVITYMIQIWMYATPVVWSVEIIPEKWLWLAALNPMTGIVDAYRSAILGKPFSWGLLDDSLLVGTVLFGFGLYFFRRLEKRFADII